MTTENLTDDDVNDAGAAVADAVADAIADASVEAITPQPPAMRIVRIQDCASLSGRSTLTYHIGYSEVNSERHLRIFANTAKGYFCKDWVSLSLLDLLLSETKGFASSTVQQMFFEGKSVNSGGFVLAALRNEGLIRAIPGSLRSYERLDGATWQQEILALIQAGVSLSGTAVASGVAGQKEEQEEALMLDLTLALVVVAALGLCFSTTRQIGILSTAVLCFLYPALVIVLIVVGGGIYLRNHLLPKFGALHLDEIKQQAVIEFHHGMRDKYALPEVRMHDLRHSMASNMVNSGRSIFEVAKVLGHTQIRTSQRYSHLSNETLLAAVDASANATGTDWGQAQTAKTGDNLALAAA